MNGLDFANRDARVVILLDEVVPVGGMFLSGIFRYEDDLVLGNGDGVL